MCRLTGDRKWGRWHGSSHPNDTLLNINIIDCPIETAVTNSTPERNVIIEYLQRIVDSQAFPDEVIWQRISLVRLFQAFRTGPSPDVGNHSAISIWAEYSCYTQFEKWHSKKPEKAFVEHVRVFWTEELDKVSCRSVYCLSNPECIHIV